VRGRGILTATVVLGILANPTAAALQTCPVPREVPRDELVAAMRQHGAYNIVATTNWGRFQMEVFLRLMRAALAQDSAGGILVISAEDWYQAYYDVARLTPETVPEGTRRSHEVGQMIHLDFRRGQVIRAIREGPTPDLAANVRISWPVKRGLPEKYSYRDTLSVPQLKVTSHRLITFRLLAFGDTVFYDKMKGISGRPMSGILGAIFWFIGEGALMESSMAVASDGILVARARSKKVFSKTATVTVLPDGRGDNGILPDRPDLAAIEQRLQQAMEFEYFPYTC